MHYNVIYKLKYTHTNTRRDGYIPQLARWLHKGTQNYLCVIKIK